jgi:hypothetical protein
MTRTWESPMNFKGKKAFCFLALKHHSRFLLPITRVLERQGMDIQYLTAPAEMPFELTLQDEGLPYRHTQHYADSQVLDEIDRAYRQVREAWKEKFFQSEVLHHFTLPIQDKILRMHTDNFYLFRRMFEVEKPDVVLALHELNSWGKILGYLSHEFRVPLVTLQEGLYYAPAAVYRFHTEYSSACLVWGEATREVLVNSGGCADKIFVVGNTHLQTVVAKESARAAVKRTKSDLNVGKEKKIITLLMGGLGYDKSFTFPPALLNWVRARPELVLICKWHPVTNKLALEEIARSLAAIENIRMLQEFDTYRVLAASDVCIVFGNSTTGLEALAFGKPLIEVQLSGLDYSFARQGVADAVSSLVGLPHAVDTILSGAQAGDRAARVENYLSRNLYRLDGKSVERCVDAVEKILLARESGRERRAVLLPAVKDKLACSVILPLQSVEGAAETLLGVAENTPDELPYECVISTHLAPDERGEFINALAGDITVLQSDQATRAGLCNLGAARAAGKYLCFLNPGWVPQGGWLEGLARQLDDHPEVGIVGGLALFRDGLLAHAGIAIDANLSPLSIYRRLPATFPGCHRERHMRAVVGCLLVRRETFLAAGGFDPFYRGRWGEIDFCLAAGQSGWQVAYTPASLFISLDESSADDGGDRLRFFAKWVGDLWPDQDSHWQADRVDATQLAGLYRETIQDAVPGENLTR